MFYKNNSTVIKKFYDQAEKQFKEMIYKYNRDPEHKAIEEGKEILIVGVEQALVDKICSFWKHKLYEANRLKPRRFKKRYEAPKVPNQ